MIVDNITCQLLNQFFLCSNSFMHLYTRCNSLLPICYYTLVMKQYIEDLRRNRHKYEPDRGFDLLLQENVKNVSQMFARV